MVVKDSAEWVERVKNVKSIMDFYFDTTFSRFDPKTSEGKREIAKALLPAVKKIPNRIVQSHWVNELAKKLQVRSEDVEEELSKLKDDHSDKFGIEPEEEMNIPVKTRKELVEERLIVLFLKYPAQLEALPKERFSTFSAQGRELTIKLKDNPGLSAKDLDADLASWFNTIALMSEVEDIVEKDAIEDVGYCLREVDSLELKHKLAEISKEIKRAKLEEDADKEGELLLKYQQLLTKPNEKENKTENKAEGEAQEESSKENQ
jgi:DNA primase